VAKRARERGGSPLPDHVILSLSKDLQYPSSSEMRIELKLLYRKNLSNAVLAAKRMMPAGYWRSFDKLRMT
jgi:hypothetical protein